MQEGRDFSRGQIVFRSGKTGEQDPEINYDLRPAEKIINQRLAISLSLANLCSSSSSSSSSSFSSSSYRLSLYIYPSPIHLVPGVLSISIRPRAQVRAHSKLLHQCTLEAMVSDGYKCANIQ
ncbi:hypothetical protein E2C01_099263 [Portunus trituberculatus]|uniref:Uncharacterized protein n=1 Tax=Portunus trituberculatus TaxID=210409 RepID=A0A5B7K3E6_PORTR|nr:hypothetical protein [Portunus trituberculatus]